MAEIQILADRNNSKAFYASLREVYGPQGASLDLVKSIDGSVLHMEKHKFMERWKKHFNRLLNPKTGVEDGVNVDIPQLAFRYHMNQPPTAEELKMAIKRTKC